MRRLEALGAHALECAEDVLARTATRVGEFEYRLEIPLVPQ